MSISLACRRSLFSNSNHQAFARLLSSSGNYEYLLVEQKGSVGWITLNRPKALNALCDGLIDELNKVTTEMDSDPNVRAIVITGSEKAFAAGADIKEMAPRSFMEVYKGDMFAPWANLTKIGKPIIGAVNGFALGGGCELAMMCDILIAGDSAKFGQPEIKLGTIPGCGGTQRLVRAIGKSRAMELILTGDMMSAEEACSRGLVSRVVPKADLAAETLATAEKIASYSIPIAKMCKEAVNKSYEMTLTEGTEFERRLFHATFATRDQKEGMDAFVNKRAADFVDE
jgi:enoyl-CoA hydratase/carnithine racemase